VGKRRRYAKKKTGDVLQEDRLVLKASDPGAKEHLENLAAKLKDKLPEETHDVEHDGIQDETYDTSRMLAIRTQAISYGFPFDELTYSKWVIRLLLLHRPMPWDDVIVARSTYLPDARNIIHKSFVTKSSNEWLWMIDSDVIPPPNILQSFFKHHKETGAKMIGGWYRKKGDPYRPVVYDFDHTDKTGINQWKVREIPGKGLEKVDGAGAGCWFMHRDIAEALGEKPYDMSEGGEDLTLCKRVTDLGYDIYIDWDMACAHVGVAVV
jgi:hypothetical protein